MSIAEYFQAGGVFMWPILLCGIVGFAICVERAFFVYLRAAIHAPPFVATVQRLLVDGQVEEAVRLCNAESAAVLPRVLKAGLLRADRPDGEIRDALEEAALEVQPLVTRRITLLPTIANVATLLGLLGTIQGLILSFHAVGAADAETRSTALAEGIAVSMNTTFAGLCVAIPVLLAHALVANRANGLLDEIDHYSLRLVNLLNALRQPAPADPVLPFRR